MLPFGVAPPLAMLLALLAGLALGVWLRRRGARDVDQITDLYEQRLRESANTLAERDARLNAATQELASLRGEREHDRRNLADAEVLVSQLRSNVAETQALPRLLQERERQIALLQDDMDAMRTDYATEVAELRRRLGDADQLRTQLARYEQQLRTLDARLALVQRDKDQVIAECGARIAELEPLAQRAAAAPPQTSPPSPQPQAATDEEPAGSRRELERDLARLRQRIMQLENLYTIIQDRDGEILQLKQQLTERNS